MTVVVAHVTETGTAEMVAEDVADAVGAPDPMPLARLAPGGLTSGAVHLIVCSTYGEGDLPAAGRPFVEALAEGVRLDGARFSIFALGDSSYETFAGGGDVLRAALVSAGATEVAPIVRHDATGPDLPEDAATEWATAIMASDIAA